MNIITNLTEALSERAKVRHGLLMTRRLLRVRSRRINKIITRFLENKIKGTLVALARSGLPTNRITRNRHQRYIYFKGRSWHLNEQLTIKFPHNMRVHIVLEYVSPEKERTAEQFSPDIAPEEIVKEMIKLIAMCRMGV
ncbi:MAG: hypothetical protein ACXQTL_08660 [Methanosarcinales archaeon]